MQQTENREGPGRLASSVGEFVVTRQGYYSREFGKIQSATRFPWSWNTAAALAGPFWGASRGLWGVFWMFLVLEALAFVQIGRGWWGDLGAGKLAVRVAEEAALAAGGATTFLLVGLALLAGLRLVQGFYANTRYEKQYLIWRANPAGTAAGISWTRTGLAGLLWLGVVPLTLYRFTVGKIDPALEPYIAGLPIRKKLYYAPVSDWLDAGFDWLSIEGAGVFNGVVTAIRTILWKRCWSTRRGRWS